MSSGAIYNADWRIVRSVSCHPDMLPLQCRVGEWLYVGEADGNTHYFDSHIRTDRPEMTGGLSPASITTAETATLTGPEGAQVTISGPVSGSDTLDADGIQISSDIPGTYTVTVTLFPYLDAEYQLEITEP